MLNVRLDLMARAKCAKSCNTFRYKTLNHLNHFRDWGRIDKVTQLPIPSKERIKVKEAKCDPSRYLSNQLSCTFKNPVVSKGTVLVWQLWLGTSVSSCFYRKGVGGWAQNAIGPFWALLLGVRNLRSVHSVAHTSIWGTPWHGIRVIV